MAFLHAGFTQFQSATSKKVREHGATARQMCCPALDWPPSQEYKSFRYHGSQDTSAAFRISMLAHTVMFPSTYSLRSGPQPTSFLYLTSCASAQTNIFCRCPEIIHLRCTSIGVDQRKDHKCHIIHALHIRSMSCTTLS